MKEYQIRIQEHEKRLPHLREKIAAAMVLFIVASLMLSVVTFAWLTLSVAPEASDISMSIAANGSLEIALAYDVLRDANGDPIFDENGNVIPVAPGASQVGDSNLDLLSKNRTWGNLVNLSDPVYGLENIVLRPATLNTGSLLSQPLYAATYTEDGRISTLRSDFAYAQWNSTLGKFEQSSYKGIKAISSVEFDEVQYDNPLLQAYALKVENIEKALEKARSDFNALASSSEISAINGIMTTYMNGTLKVSSDNPNALDNEPCTVDDIQKFYTIMVNIYNGPMQTMGEAFMEIIELYQLDTYGQNNSTDLNYERFTDLDKFCTEITAYMTTMNADRTAGNKSKITFENLTKYVSDRAKLKTYIDALALYKDQDTQWGDIKHIVNWVVDINTTEINGKTIKTLTSSLSQYASELLGMIGEGKASQNNAVVKKGLMHDLDMMLHNGVEGFKIPKATIYIDLAALKTRVQNSSMSSMAGMVDWVISGDTGVAEANIKTSGPDEVAIGTTRTDVKSAFTTVGAQSVAKTYVAKDTYGLSVDFWIRTNAANSFLMLEGEVKYKYEDVIQNIIRTDADGNSVTHENIQIYLAKVKTTTTDTTGDEPVTTVNTAENQEVYQLDNVWYYLTNNQPVVVAEEDVLDENENKTGTRKVEIDGTPEKKQNEIPIGYSGANRIWTEEELAGMSESEYRTTQGAGSCYTFYADPAEAEQIMEILAALKIAFVDAEGDYIGGARLATELCISEYGKHTVPIVLDESCMETGQVDENGKPIYAITQLEKNTPTLITALIYLDGTVVTNEKVLSSSNIEGSFNIQFGSTDVLVPIENEELMGDEIRVSGSIVGGNVNVDYTKEMETTGYDVNVALNIDGSTPSSVYAYFLRKISATQGTKQEKLVFTLNSSGQWVATMNFKSPGEYILRSVIVDGIERELQIAEGASPPTVTINGFSCTNFHGINGQSYIFRTASNMVNEKFTVTVAAKDEELIPKSVQAIFIGQGDNTKTVTVNMTDEDGDTNYEGIATFQSSGTYVCEYLLVNGDYYQLPVAYTREVYTGLKVQVWISQAEGDPEFTTGDNGENVKLTNKGYQYIHKGIDHNFNIQMRIYDSAGNTVEGLGNIQIFYSLDKHANLVWNSSSRYYVGQLPTIKTPGVYEFNRVTVGNEIINSARNAMSVTAIPSDPVSYVGLNGEIPSQVILIDGYADNVSSATVSLEFKNADAAAVFGKFSRTYEGGTEYYILKAATSADTDMANYKTFTIPDLDGVWKLEEVKMSLVYDGTTKTFFMGDDSLESLFESGATYVPVMSAGDTPVDLWATAGNEEVESEQYYLVEAKDEWTESKVIKTLNASVTNNADDYNADNTNDGANVYSGHDFMVEYGIINTVTFDDLFSGEIAGGVTNVKIKYTRQAGTAKSNGGYTWTGDGSTNNEMTIELNTQTTADGKVTFTNAMAGKLNVAGVYNVELSYDYNGHTITNSLDTIIIKTNTPTVIISGISQTNGATVDAYVSHSRKYLISLTINTTKYTVGYDNTTANVCYTAKKSNGMCNITQPWVTMKLSGLGNATGATLSFDGTGYIYASSAGTAKTQYTWSANGDCKRYIGQWNSVTGDDSRTIAGTMNANKFAFTVTVDGVTTEYVFDTPAIQINNPY